MDYKHSQRAERALTKLSELDPAFASLSLWCNHRDAEPKQVQVVGLKEGKVVSGTASFELAPAYTDGSTVFYGASYSDWTLDEQVGVAAHELYHVAFRHVTRGKKLYERFGSAYDPRLFNIATDAIINTTLILAKYTLPKSRIELTELLKEVFGENVSATDAIKEWDAEKLYIRLVTEKQKQAQQKQGGGSGSGTGSGEFEDGSGGKSAADAAKEYAEGKGFGDDLDTSGPSTTEDAQDDAAWQQRLTQALNHGKMAGRGIGKIGHLIGDLPKSTTPWEVLLRRLVMKAVTRIPTQSFQSPTRRWLGMDADARMRGLTAPAYEPGFLKQSSHPRVAIGIDVSGSISDQILEIFAGEIAAIGRQTGCELHLFVFDDGVLSEQKLDGVDFEAEVKKVKFARGGGTSFVEVMDRAMAIDPSIIVMLTDLHGPFGEAPDRKVIWASPEDNPPQPPFGDLIQLNR